VWLAAPFVTGTGLIEANGASVVAGINSVPGMLQPRLLLPMWSLVVAVIVGGVWRYREQFPARTVVTTVSSA
jgi:hypothetical protein